MAVVEEVTGDKEVGLVGNRTFASNVQPKVSREQAIEPDLEYLIGDPFIAPQP